MKSTSSTTISQPPVGKARSVISGYWLVALAAVLLLVGLRQIFGYYWQMWTDHDSYSSHGPLVPILAAVMVWQNKDRLLGTRKTSSWAGIPMIAAALPLYIVGLGVGWHPVCGLALFLFLYGVVLSMLGRGVLKIVFGPILFLITMVPLPPLLIDALTGRYQVMSTTLAVRALNILGHEVLRDGSTLLSGSLPAPLVVGGPCSGLKLLIALVMCGAFLAYMLEGPVWKKLVLFASAFPLSVFANTLRVIMIAYVGFWSGSAQTTAKFHDYSGYISLAVCAGLVIGVSWLLGMRTFREFPSGDAGDHRPILLDSPRAVVILLLMALVGLGGVVTGLYVLPNGHVAREEIPRTFGSWSSEEKALDPYARGILARADLVNLVYTDRQIGRKVSVIVESDLDVESFHDPFGCLPGSNIKIDDYDIITLGFEKPRRISVAATMLGTSDDYSGNRLIVYWYMMGSRSYCRTFEDLRGMAFRDRISDLGRVVANPFSLPKVKREINSRQITWYRFAMDKSNDGHDQEYLERFIQEFVSRVPSFGKPLDWQIEATRRRTNRI